MYTKTQLLDAFCRSKNYQNGLPVLDENGFPTEKTTPNPETKLKFLERTEREWAKGEAIRQLMAEEREQAELEVSANVAGIEL